MSYNGDNKSVDGSPNKDMPSTTTATTTTTTKLAASSDLQRIPTAPQQPPPVTARDEEDQKNALVPTTTTASEMLAPGIAMGPVKRRILMLSICLALFLAALDMTIVATALPTITAQLDATAAQYAWIGSSYTLASTAMSPLWAKASDIFGRKSIMMACNAIFMAGSLVAALAGSVEILIAGRTVQGVGGGGLLILVTILISDLFHIKDRAKYYGLTGLVFALASSVGPVLGGVFTSTIGWRWCCEFL
jgi:Na+/melibiose symporter-like transporter